MKGLVMKRIYFLSLLVFLPQEVWADEISGNIGITSDYVFRGISQSDEGPALQGGIDYSHESGFYTGLWGSSVDFDDGDEANLEIDAFVGINGETRGIAWDAGAIYYAYPGADSSLDYDFFELAVSAGYDFDIAAASVAVNYSPEFFERTGNAEYYAAYLDVPLPYDLSLNAHMGYQDIEKSDDYNDWSIGLGYTLSGFEFNVAYHDTDLKEPAECHDGCSQRVVFSLTKRFP